MRLRPDKKDREGEWGWQQYLVAGLQIASAVQQMPSYAYQSSDGFQYRNAAASYGYNGDYYHQNVDYASRPDGKGWTDYQQYSQGS